MTLECLAPHGTFISTHSETRGALQRRGQREGKTQRLGEMLWNSIFWTRHGCCIHEFRAAVVTYIRLGDYIMHRKDHLKLTPHWGEPLTLGSYWVPGQEAASSPAVWSLSSHALVNNNPLLQATVIKHDASCTRKDTRVGRGFEGREEFQWKKKTVMGNENNQNPVNECMKWSNIRMIPLQRCKWEIQRVLSVATHSKLISRLAIDIQGAVDSASVFN